MLSPAERNPKVISTLVFVFLAGAATGAVSMRLGLHEKLHRTVAAAAPKPGAIPQNSDVLLQRFKNELNLTPDQTQKISVVLNDYRTYFDSLREQLDDVRATGKTRILEILDEDQRKKFEKISTDMVPAPGPSAAAANDKSAADNK